VISPRSSMAHAFGQSAEAHAQRRVGGLPTRRATSSVLMLASVISPDRSPPAQRRQRHCFIRASRPS
jgi:hypothetical protein